MPLFLRQPALRLAEDVFEFRLSRGLAQIGEYRDPQVQHDPRARIQCLERMDELSVVKAIKRAVETWRWLALEQLENILNQPPIGDVL